MPRPTAPNAVPTPLKKQEPTLTHWKSGGTSSVSDALANDKGSIRQPVSSKK